MVRGIDLADLWVIAVATATSAACALVGVFLVLRRQSLLGDALSHAVLPGLVVAFVLSGTVSLGPMVVGALAVGLLTAALSEWLQQRGGVTSDASLGVVYTTLFALGVVLIKRFAARVHLDPDCLLFGLIEFAPLYTVSIGGYEIPRSLASMFPVLCLDVCFVALCWKELKIATFDASLATALGFPAAVLHYGLLAVVTLTTVAAFEAVGSVLVVAMLIAPAATAHLLTDRLATLVLLSVAIGVTSSVMGYGAAVYFDTNTAGMMALVAGVIYLAMALAAPRYGILGKWLGRVATASRIRREDLLSLLYKWEEQSAGSGAQPISVTTALGGGWLLPWGLWLLTRRGEIVQHQGQLTLTPRGRARAAQLVRAHRLWESYLVEHLGISAESVHLPAERMEHFISEELQRQIAGQLSDSQADPHGRDIPRE